MADYTSQFTRDPHSQALVCSDQRELDAFKKKKTAVNKIDLLEQRINTLEKKIDKLLEIFANRDI